MVDPPHTHTHTHTPNVRTTGIPVLSWLHRGTGACLCRSSQPLAGLAGASSASDEALLDAIEAHPILMNRPIVVSPAGVKLCRPSETVLDLLPAEGLQPFTKADGEVVIDSDGRRVR